MMYIQYILKHRNVCLYSFCTCKCQGVHLFTAKKQKFLEFLIPSFSCRTVHDISCMCLYVSVCLFLCLSMRLFLEPTAVMTRCQWSYLYSGFILCKVVTVALHVCSFTLIVYVIYHVATFLPILVIYCRSSEDSTFAFWALFTPTTLATGFVGTL